MLSNIGNVIYYSRWYIVLSVIYYLLSMYHLQCNIYYLYYDMLSNIDNIIYYSRWYIVLSVIYYLYYDMLSNVV